MSPFTRRAIPCLRRLLLVAGLLLAGGCAAIQQVGSAFEGVSESVVEVGPPLSSQHGKAALSASGVPRLDVVVPVFDPNLPADSDTWAKLGIFPELRRAEANRFALKMKAALEAADAFGAVRVAPNKTATGDLYIIGKIIRSTGEHVEIELTVADISGRKWFEKNFKHRVKASFHGDIRNEGKDSYDPVFEKAAAHIVEKLNKRNLDDLKKLPQIAEIRFAAGLSEETFSRYLKTRNGRAQLTAAPADNDPMLQRIKPIRVRDQLFIDDMQVHYANFDAKMNDSYLAWQIQSVVEITAARQAKRKAVTQGILGGLLVAAGIAAAASGSDSAVTDVAALGGIVAGAAVLGGGYQTRQEMKAHRDALVELGQSINLEMAPRVVEYEQQNAQLSGDAAAQYAQWRDFLKKIYHLEATPEKQL